MRIVLDARTASFASIIDYAGVFPPASLSMEAAVDTYRRHRATADRWVLGRFLCRASQLEDLAAVAMATMHRDERQWDVGVIFDVSTGAATSLAREFHRELGPAMAVTAAEARIDVDDPGMLIDAVSTIDADVATFIEIDPDEPVRPQLEAIGATLRDRGRTGGAKIRCGGGSPNVFPSDDDVAEFIWEASLTEVPFKATAALHQPFRVRDDDLDVLRHGFVNILLAAVAADQGENRNIVEKIVAETDPGAFSLTASAARWKDFIAPGSAIRRSRHNGFLSFGSCDLDEPMGALHAISSLGEGT